jgi:V8-like Glu-specific endopeptidase
MLLVSKESPPQKSTASKDSPSASFNGLADRAPIRYATPWMFRRAVVTLPQTEHVTGPVGRYSCGIFIGYVVCYAAK